MTAFSAHVTSSGRVKPTFGTVAAAIAGVALSAIGFFAASAWDERRAERNFAALAQDHVHTLQHGIDDYLGRLTGLRALFQMAGDKGVTRTEFENFSWELMQDRPGLLAMSWSPRVLHADRAAHERAAQADGIPGYRISAIDEKGNKAGPAPKHADYYPAYYSTLAHDARAYGVDLQDGGVRQHPLDRARDNDVIAASENFRLQTGRYGFYAVMPIYRAGTAHRTLEERRANITGFVRSTFQFHVLADAVLSEIQAPVNFYLFEADGDATNPPVYVRKNGMMSNDRPARADLTLQKIRWIGHLQVGDRRWEAVAVPSGTSLLVRHNRAWLVLIGGLLVTAVLTVYVWMSARYVRMLEEANTTILEQALTDPLTGLSNRRAFVERLTEACETADRTGNGFAVHFIDLDGFKEVNDAHGHPMGDELLRQVAARLRGRLREIDVVARFGGDEFAVLQTLIASPSAVSMVAEDLVRTLAAPYTAGALELNVTASLGIALYSPQSDGPTSLMMHADLALYAAKAAGRNRVCVYSPGLEPSAHSAPVVSQFAERLPAARHGGLYRSPPGGLPGFVLR